MTATKYLFFTSSSIAAPKLRTSKTLTFAEAKDNVLGVLTNAQIFLVMLTAMVLKREAGRTEEGEVGVGILLVFLNVLCAMLFVGLGVTEAYGYKQELDMGQQTEEQMARGLLEMEVLGESKGSGARVRMMNVNGASRRAERGGGKSGERGWRTPF